MPEVTRYRNAWLSARKRAQRLQKRVNELTEELSQTGCKHFNDHRPCPGCTSTKITITPDPPNVQAIVDQTIAELRRHGRLR